MKTVCRIEHWEWQQRYYVIAVYRQQTATGCPAYTAEVRLSFEDQIICDGRSVDEALELLKEILPISLEARAVAPSPAGTG